MSNVYTSTGARLYVSASQPATEDQAGFEAIVDWVEVAEVVDMGEFGGSAEVVTHAPLNSGRTIKRKGTINDGQMALQLGKDLSDAGQAALKSGFDGANRAVVHSWKIVHPTAPDGSVLTQYNRGQIYGDTTNLGSTNNIVGASVPVEFEIAMVEVIA